MEGKYLQPVYLYKEMYLKHKEHLKLSSKKPKSSIEK